MGEERKIKRDIDRGRVKQDGREGEREGGRERESERERRARELIFEESPSLHMSACWVQRCSVEGIEFRQRQLAAFELRIILGMKD